MHIRLQMITIVITKSMGRVVIAIRVWKDSFVSANRYESAYARELIDLAARCAQVLSAEILPAMKQ